MAHFYDNLCFSLEICPLLRLQRRVQKLTPNTKIEKSLKGGLAEFWDVHLAPPTPCPACPLPEVHAPPLQKCQGQWACRSVLLVLGDATCILTRRQGDHSFACWQYCSQWGLPEAWLLLIEGKGDHPTGAWPNQASTLKAGVFTGTTLT